MIKLSVCLVELDYTGEIADTSTVKSKKVISKVMEDVSILKSMFPNLFNLMFCLMLLKIIFGNYDVSKFEKLNHK